MYRMSHPCKTCHEPSASYYNLSCLECWKESDPAMAHNMTPYAQMLYDIAHGNKNDDKFFYFNWWTSKASWGSDDYFSDSMRAWRDLRIKGLCHIDDKDTQLFTIGGKQLYTLTITEFNTDGSVLSRGKDPLGMGGGHFVDGSMMWFVCKEARDLFYMVVMEGSSGDPSSVLLNDKFCVFLKDTMRAIVAKTDNAQTRAVLNGIEKQKSNPLYTRLIDRFIDELAIESNLTVDDLKRVFIQ